MNEFEKKYCDRATWGGGPWEEEPDEKAWEHEGFACQAIRSHWGAWCGYIAVPKGHPWWGKTTNQLGDVNVHGGVTWAQNHTAKNDPDGRWWVGFDCSHAYDYNPGLAAMCRDLPGRERTVGDLQKSIDAMINDRLRRFVGFDTYVTLRALIAETEELADQALQVAQQVSEGRAIVEEALKEPTE